MGKTTCAAAWAVVRARSGARTLLISTDPAPSVGDALNQRFGAVPRRVAGVANLSAVEVDSPKALARWLRSRRPILETIALRGTFLDREDVAALLRLSLPGIDEIAALMEISRLGRSGGYDTVVVDTAPTGHTLRMLAMPMLLGALAGVFDRMQGKHRAIVRALGGGWTRDAADALIESIAAEGRELSTLLADRRSVDVTWVTLPEPMAMAESVDALHELHRMGLHVEAMVVNRVTPPPSVPCRWCNARRAFESATIRAITVRAGKLGPRAIAARAREPRGVAALREIGREMASGIRLPRTAAARGRQVVTDLPTLSRRRFVLPDAAGLSLLMFGGKGGVGKTTCAAATAVRVAAEQPHRPVILLSADPAHSLGDVLGVPLDDAARHVRGAPANLTAREIDAANRFQIVKGEYAKAIDALFVTLGSGTQFELSADRDAMRDLLELAPPGVDELMAMVDVSEILGNVASQSLIVLDTAPSGHALRLLELPALVHDWVKALMTIVLKYQPVVGIGELGQVLLRMSQGLGRLRALLTDPARTAFLTVTRPAALPAAETRRLLKQLQDLHISGPAVIVNSWGLGTCKFCTTGRREQEKALRQIRASARTSPLVIAPATMPPPHGPKALLEWAARWIVD